MMTRIRKHLSVSRVLAFTALFAALGGGAYAAGLAKNSVKSKHIAPDAVRGADVKEASLGEVPKAASAKRLAAPAAAELARGKSLGARDVADGETVSLDVGPGTVFVDCDASGTDSVTYNDVPGDGADTIAWLVDNGIPQVAWEVPDGYDETYGFGGLNDYSRTIHILGGDGSTALVRVSTYDADGACAIAITATSDSA